MSKLGKDRYHGAMGNASTLVSRTPSEYPLADVPARFYITQRKLFAAPAVGHKRLLRALTDGDINRNHNVFEANYLNKIGLPEYAKLRAPIDFIREIRSVRPGTITFAGQPIVDIYGNFGAIQAQEIAFEHAFDEPMTVASRAMDMKRAANGFDVMDFSLRRDGSDARAKDVAYYSYIGGFDQTSNMEAGYDHDIPVVGTMAHYWVQAFTGAGTPEKHFQQVAFEAWLDANPQGTMLLLDTINVKLGIKHAILAAKSSPERMRAFKGVRIDSGNLGELAVYTYSELIYAEVPVEGFKIALTGDLDAEGIQRIVSTYGDERARVIPLVFGVGTKLIAEIPRVAGVIFKLCEINGLPTFKGSDSFDKATLPGKLQIMRGVNENGNYVGDITVLDRGDDWEESFELLRQKGATHFNLLLEQFYHEVEGFKMPVPSAFDQRAFIQEELKKFGYLMNYPTRISLTLTKMRHELWEEFNA